MKLLPTKKKRNRKHSELCLELYPRRNHVNNGYRSLTFAKIKTSICRNRSISKRTHRKTFRRGIGKKGETEKLDKTDAKDIMDKDELDYADTVQTQEHENDDRILLTISKLFPNITL